MVLNLLASTLVVWTSLFGLADIDDEPPYHYFAPLPGAELVSTHTTIGIRPGPDIDADSVDTGLFEVIGSKSGRHSGNVVLARDGRTVLFKPSIPFAPGETVDVSISAKLSTVGGTLISGFAYSFVVSPKEDAPANRARASSIDLVRDVGALGVQADVLSASAADENERRYFTLPADFPTITVTVNLEPANDDAIFLGPVPTNWGALILDADGEPIYFRPRPFVVLNFQKQLGERLSYFDWSNQEYHVLDNTYTLVDKVNAAHGYTIDGHEFIIRENGNYLFMIYDPQPIDMSRIVAGGRPTATVEGLIIQELDMDDNVVFEWRSWDHIPLSDTHVDLTDGDIDYVHGNSIEVDNDGHLLVSSRHLDEITKINRESGEIIWRMGGKANQFTFGGDDVDGFRIQHDARRLANGNLTLFDNHSVGGDPNPFSRAVEYRLDEENLTAELVWSYRNTPDVFGGRHGKRSATGKRKYQYRLGIGNAEHHRSNTGQRESI